MIQIRTLFKPEGDPREQLLREDFEEAATVAACQQENDKTCDDLRYKRQCHFLNLRQCLNECDTYADHHRGADDRSGEDHRQPNGLLNELQGVSLGHDTGYPIVTPASIGTSWPLVSTAVEPDESIRTDSTIPVVPSVPVI